MELNAYFKSLVDQDRAAVVICDLEHTIIYMNPAAIASYAKHGGAALLGKSVLISAETWRTPSSLVVQLLCRMRRRYFWARSNTISPSSVRISSASMVVFPPRSIRKTVLIL